MMRAPLSLSHARALLLAIACATTTVCVASAVAGCGGAPATPVRTVSFRVKGQPSSATVTIDDQPIGPLEMVEKRGIALPAGPHRITVEAPGYLPLDRIVTAGEEPIRLQVDLVRIPE